MATEHECNITEYKNSGITGKTVINMHRWCCWFWCEVEEFLLCLGIVQTFTVLPSKLVSFLLLTVLVFLLAFTFAQTFNKQPQLVYFSDDIYIVMVINNNYVCRRTHTTISASRSEMICSLDNALAAHLRSLDYLAFWNVIIIININ